MYSIWNIELQPKWNIPGNHAGKLVKRQKSKIFYIVDFMEGKSPLSRRCATHAARRSLALQIKFNPLLSYIFKKNSFST